MLGLGSYQSSSEDEMENDNSLPRSKSVKEEHTNHSLRTNQAQTGSNDNYISQESSTNKEPSGPMLGPPHSQESEVLLDRTYNLHPSEVRTFIHDLTLPPVPKLDIPPSPPGSPDPGANAKFGHFVSLKKQGVHFNEKLSGSTSLKNPSLLRKLRDHVAIDDQRQYSTSLPNDIWDASTLPGWGFKEELLKTRQEISYKKEEKKALGQRGSIEFVAGATGPS